MGQCHFIKLCPVFDSTVSNVSAEDLESYRQKYCHADRFACARYLVATSVGRDKVPVDLGPTESARALKIMRDTG